MSIATETYPPLFTTKWPERLLIASRVVVLALLLFTMVFEFVPQRAADLDRLVFAVVMTAALAIAGGRWVADHHTPKVLVIEQFALIIARSLVWTIPLIIVLRHGILLAHEWYDWIVPVLLALTWAAACVTRLLLSSEAPTERLPLRLLSWTVILVGLGWSFGWAITDATSLYGGVALAVGITLAIAGSVATIFNLFLVFGMWVDEVELLTNVYFREHPE